MEEFQAYPFQITNKSFLFGENSFQKRGGFFRFSVQPTKQYNPAKRPYSTHCQLYFSCFHRRPFSLTFLIPTAQFHTFLSLIYFSEYRRNKKFNIYFNILRIRLLSNKEKTIINYRDRVHQTNSAKHEIQLNFDTTMDVQ